jgi:acyl-CoA synthetase (AMP-forming)/AMP-acid ligase II/pimeloyl-ACP methyl ester carboxylesterase
MGFSERTGRNRRLTGHIADLTTVTTALGIDGPVVTVAHDWGGPISLGWALAHRDQIAGIVLMNTGVARPDGVRVPPLIQAVRTKATLRTACVTTPAFLRGTLRLAHPSLPSPVRQGFLAPYRDRSRRQGIGDFVEDIPFTSQHPTHTTLDEIASELDQFADTPALLLWGAKDPVFSTAFLTDIRDRMPHASVHLYQQAGHLVMEDIGGEHVILDWLETISRDESDKPGPQAQKDATDAGRGRLWSEIERRRKDNGIAVAEMDTDGSAAIAREVSFAELMQRVELLSDRLLGVGVRSGDRVAPLIRPGIDLVEMVYACWRIGAVVVAADAALGIRGVARALRGSRPDFIVSDRRGLALARALGLPGHALSLTTFSRAAIRTLGVTGSLDEPIEVGPQHLPRTSPGPDDLAAVVFTSGSTGPSKGVVYRHGQLEAQRDVLAATYSVDQTDRLVAAFAPFAILGPALGIASVVPAMDVSSPATLDARAFANATLAIGATLAFASPAALSNIAATAHGLDTDQHLALSQVRAIASAGAPISLDMLRSIKQCFPNGELQTPYGMTEVMPVTNVSLEQVEAAGPGNGVCVGFPVDGVEVAVSALDASGGSTWDFVHETGVTGEICVRAKHTSDGYDSLWAIQNSSRRAGWHRTGDVGHIDGSGRVWVEGRTAHLILTADGPLTPVAIEHEAEQVTGVERAAAVGVGPIGTQQLVVVVATAGSSKDVVANRLLTDAVRTAVTPNVAAVLTAKRLPVDRRHNAKVERTQIATWAEAVLAGRRARRL